jgi:hypothetical protein
MLIIFVGPLLGQDSKSILAHRINSSDIVLDGRLDEQFWSEIAESDEFLMQEPVEGSMPTERTVVKIAYDQSNLFIGVVLYDSSPSEIKAFQKRRDAELDTDDAFRWILDTYLDGRNAYYFEINPAGLIGDGLVTTGHGTSVDKSWDGIWRPWTYVGDFGWSVEVRIPFRTLNFNPSLNSWGINFERIIRRKNEVVLWTGHQRNQGLRPQDAGRLVNLSGVSQGLGLEVVPYGKLESIREETEIENEYQTDTKITGGFDVNYNLTPGLKASFTLNTDFAETEVDTRQINLTRFPLFFPERRDFFLEGSNIHQFAPRSGIYPYFSRRIGLEQGSPIPVNYGARIIGQMGRYELAAQYVRTKQRDQLNAEDFTVFRLKRDFLKESSIGVVYTRRHTKNGEELADPLQDRHTLGADLSLNTSTFLKNKNLQFQAFLAHHNPASPLDDSTSFWDRTTRGIRFNFPNNPWNAAVSYREFGHSYDPAVGFNRRNAFRRVEPQMTYSPLIESSNVVRELTWGWKFEHLMDLDWNKLTQNVGIQPFGIRFESGERATYEFVHNFEKLQEPFDILGDGSVVIPVGNYNNWIHEIGISTAEFRKVVLDLEILTGGFWSGTRTQFGTDLTIRPFPGINLITQYVHTNVDLQEGAFETNIIRFTGNFDFSPFISFSTNIQFDDLSDQLGINNRFRYTITPGSDVFLVYNHNWIDHLDRFSTVSNAGILKTTLTYRF